MMAADLAPGLMRVKCGVPAALDPPVLRWNHPAAQDGNVRDAWNALLVEATRRAQAGLKRLQADDGVVRIVGNDAHPGAVALARHAVQRAGLSRVVELRQGDCADWSPGAIGAMTTTMRRRRRWWWRTPLGACG